MPAVSLTKASTMTGGFDVEPGPNQIVSAEFVIHQGAPRKKAGANGEPAGTRPHPFTALQIGYQALNEEGESDGSEVFMQQYSTTLKFDTTSVFQPSEDGENSAGDAPGTTGEYIVAVGKDQEMSDICQCYIFLSHLVEQGFKPEELEGKPISGLVGLKGVVIHSTRENKGKKYTTPVLGQLSNFPYEAAKAPVKGKGKATAAAKPAAAAKAKPAAAAVEFDAVAHFREALATVCAERKASGKDTKLVVLVTLARQAAIKTLTDPEQVVAVKAQCENPAMVEAHGEETGLFVVDDGAVVWS